MMDTVVELLVSAFILLGASIALIGSIGLARLPDFYQRLHGATMVCTLGVGAVLVGSLLCFSWQTQTLLLGDLLIVLFLFITAPVSAYMLAKAAMHCGLPCHDRTRGKPWEQSEASQTQEK